MRQGSARTLTDDEVRQMADLLKANADPKKWEDDAARYMGFDPGPEVKEWIPLADCAVAMGRERRGSTHVLGGKCPCGRSVLTVPGPVIYLRGGQAFCSLECRKKGAVAS